MSNNKQSSVELLAIAIYEKFKMEGNGNELNDLVNQAKAMHKQEIIDSANKLLYHGTGPGDTAAEQYYNETYGGNNEQAMIDYNKMEEESEIDNYNEMNNE